MAITNKHIATLIRIRFLYFILSVFPSAFINAQNISTIAGTGVAGYNGDGILATNAQLNFPCGVVLDSVGNIYIAEFSGHRIRKITASTGIISTIAGTGTFGYNGDGILATNAQVWAPIAVTIDGNGDICFAEYGGQRIRKITLSTGIISTIAGNGTVGYNGDGILATNAELSNPNGLVFDASGNLLIADRSNYRVRKVDKISGIISTIAGTGTQGYNGDGIPATTAQISGPCGIVLNSSGDIYFSDFVNGCRIRKIDITNGLISTIAGTGTLGYNGDGIPATSAQLNWPGYLKFDNAGDLYCADVNNYRIRKITTSTGIINTIAGTGVQGYNGDGIPATTAQLGTDYYISFDRSTCNMYIGEYTNHRLRKITGGFTGCFPLVARGNLVSCQVLPAITINAGNNNTWVPIFDSVGDIAAEINANGNNLGVVNTSLFTKTGPCREDPTNRLYLNRNITITPQSQPSTPVSVRLYILKAELDSLRTAQNSLGQPSGVASINEVDVFRNNDACTTTGGNTALPLTTTNGSYNADYYLQVNVSSFSSFFFANKLLNEILPVKISSFSGTRNGAANILNWKAACNAAVTFIIERSEDGIHFTDIGSVAASDCNQSFVFTDLSPGLNKNYYRIRAIETGNTYNYSNTILLPGKMSETLQLSLNSNIVPGNVVNLQVASYNSQQVYVVITDVQGRNIFKKEINVQSGSSTISVNPNSLLPGIYWLHAIGDMGRSNIVKFIKQ